MWRVLQRIERNQGLAGLANTTYIVTKNQRNMTKKNYQKPTTGIVSVAEHQHLLAGSVRSDDKKIFEATPTQTRWTRATRIPIQPTASDGVSAMGTAGTINGLRIKKKSSKILKSATV